MKTRSVTFFFTGKKSEIYVEQKIDVTMNVDKWKEERSYVW